MFFFYSTPLEASQQYLATAITQSSPVRSLGHLAGSEIVLSFVGRIGGEAFVMPCLYLHILNNFV
jgi:hypothetical protein